MSTAAQVQSQMGGLTKSQFEIFVQRSQTGPPCLQKRIKAGQELCRLKV